MSRPYRDDPTVRIPAWWNGRWFTHDGTPEGLLSIARAAGVANGTVVATHLPEPIVLRMTAEGFVPDEMEFEQARRGGHRPHDADTVLPHLDPEFAPLIENGYVEIVDWLAEGVPAEIVKGFAARRWSSSPTGCCTRFPDGRVMVVLDVGPIDEPTLRHEMVHAAQTLEDDQAMQAALSAVAAEGRLLRADILASGADDDDLRCLGWIDAACRTAGPGRDILGVLELGLAIYPPRGISAVAKDFGIPNREGAFVALLAAAAEDNDVGIDPSSTSAREIVASRFEGGLGAAFAPIAAAIEDRFGTSKRRPAP